MALPLFEEIILNEIDFHFVRLDQGEYENCEFVNCDFENFELSGFQFSNCVFKNCNLSLAQAHKTAFRSVRFDGCKMLGIHFEDCLTFGLEMHFKNCQLDNSFFTGLSLKGCSFNACNLRQIDFTEADLEKIQFDNCNLQGATIEHCKLTETDFRTAYNHVFDPAKNRLKKTRISEAGLKGLLSHFDLLVE